MAEGEGERAEVVLLLVDFKAFGRKKKHHMPQERGKKGWKGEKSDQRPRIQCKHKKKVYCSQTNTDSQVLKHTKQAKGIRKRRRKRKSLLCTTGPTEGRWEIVWTLVQEPTEERPADD